MPPPHDGGGGSRVLKGVAKPIGVENEYPIQVGVPDEVERAEPEPYRRILVALDGSDTGSYSLGFLLLAIREPPPTAGSE